MKRLKKFLAVFFFTVAVSAFVLAFSASAEEVTCSLDGVDLYFDTETGAVTGAKDTSILTYDLEIPAEINGVKVTSIAKNAFSDLSFKRVTIPGTVETIGEYAFFNARIEELVLCYGVKTIGSSAFDVSFGSTVLKSVSFPNSLTYIGVGAFEGNRGLTSLNIPGSVTVIDDSAFAECDGIKTLILEEGVQNIGIGSFCVLGISELTIPKSVIQIGAHAFEMCEYLENVTCYSTTTIDKTAFDFCPIENMNVIEVEENLDPVLSVDGLNITVTNLGAVRDFLIAPGKHTEYYSIKLMYTGRVTAAKFEGMDSYTYNTGKPGTFTVLIRYTDGREQTYHTVTLDAVLPKVEVSGVKATVTNLENIRTIRTAPGKWSTPGEVKRAEGARNIPARNIDTTKPYSLIYETAGTYTISFEYTTGLVTVKQIEVVPIIPVFEHVGTRVTIGNLDDLYVVRYAPGEYSSSYDIKRAPGAKYLRPSKIDENGEIKLDLPEGIYSFCVQYNDGSCNYYTIESKTLLLEKYGLTPVAKSYSEWILGTYKDSDFIITLERDPANQLELPKISVSGKLSAKYWNNYYYYEDYKTLMSFTTDFGYADADGEFRLPAYQKLVSGNYYDDFYEYDILISAELTFTSAYGTETVVLETMVEKIDNNIDLLEKYGLTAKVVSLYEDKMPTMGYDDNSGAQLIVVFESSEATDLPEITVKAPTDKLLQYDPQKLTFTTISDRLLREWERSKYEEGLSWDDYSEEYFDLLLNYQYHFDIENEYAYDIYPIRLVITIGEESETITVYPVYEVAY